MPIRRLAQLASRPTHSPLRRYPRRPSHSHRNRCRMPIRPRRGPAPIARFASSLSAPVKHGVQHCVPPRTKLRLPAPRVHSVRLMPAFHPLRTFAVTVANGRFRGRPKHLGTPGNSAKRPRNRSGESFNTGRPSTLPFPSLCLLSFRSRRLPGPALRRRRREAQAQAYPLCSFRFPTADLLCHAAHRLHSAMLFEPSAAFSKCSPCRSSVLV